MIITLESVKARVRRFIRENIVDDDPHPELDPDWAPYHRLLHDMTERDDRLRW